MLTEPAEAEVSPEPQARSELRLPAAGEEQPQPAAQEELTEQAGEVHWRSPQQGAAAGCQRPEAARGPGLRR